MMLSTQVKQKLKYRSAKPASLNIKKTNIKYQKAKTFASHYVQQKWSYLNFFYFKYHFPNECYVNSIKNV